MLYLRVRDGFQPGRHLRQWLEPPWGSHKETSPLIGRAARPSHTQPISLSSSLAMVTSRLRAAASFRVFWGFGSARPTGTYLPPRAPCTTPASGMALLPVVGSCGLCGAYKPARPGAIPCHDANQLPLLLAKTSCCVLIGLSFRTSALKISRLRVLSPPWRKRSLLMFLP